MRYQKVTSHIFLVLDFFTFSKSVEKCASFGSTKIFISFFFEEIKFRKSKFCVKRSQVHPNFFWFLYLCPFGAKFVTCDLLVQNLLLVTFWCKILSVNFEYRILSKQRTWL